MSFQRSVELPKSFVLFALGTILLSTRPVKVIVSLLASPKLTSPFKFATPVIVILLGLNVPAVSVPVTAKLPPIVPLPVVAIVSLLNPPVKVVAPVSVIVPVPCGSIMIPPLLVSVVIVLPLILMSLSSTPPSSL